MASPAKIFLVIYRGCNDKLLFHSVYTALYLGKLAVKVDKD